MEELMVEEMLLDGIVETMKLMEQITF